MESVNAFIDEAPRGARRSSRVCAACWTLPCLSHLIPRDAEIGNFAKGFPEPAKDEYPEFWDLLYKELWNPEPEGDGTETNGAQIFVSQVDPGGSQRGSLGSVKTAPEFSAQPLEALP